MVNETKQLLNIEEVMQLTNKKRSTIFKHVKLNLFPAPVKTGIRSVAWRAEEVEKWIQGLSKSSYVKKETNLESIRYKEALNSLRYRWLRREFLAGRERGIAEGLNTEQELDDYIDRKISE
jgi:prophage regulatory protein